MNRNTTSRSAEEKLQLSSEVVMELGIDIGLSAIPLEFGNRTSSEDKGDF